MTSHRVKNKKVRHETKSSGVTVVFYTLRRLLWSITVYTRENVYLFYTLKIHIVWLKDFGGMKKEKQTRWRDLSWIWRHLCVCPKKIMVNNQWKCTQKSRYCITLYRHMVAVIKKIYILTSVRVSAIRTSRNCFNDAHETMAPSQAWQWDRNAIYCDFS